MKVAGGKRSAPTGNPRSEERPGGTHETRVDKVAFMRPAGARGVRAAGPVGAPLPAVEAAHRLPSAAPPGLRQSFRKKRPNPRPNSLSTIHSHSFSLPHAAI